jgi:membrane dipeptidase
MKRQEKTLSRAEFLRLMGLSSLGILLPWRFSFPEGLSTEFSGFEDEFIENLFRESFVFDGVGTLTKTRGGGRALTEPGAIKKLTGIDAGTHGVRTDRLAEHNSWLEQHKDAFYRIDRASDFQSTKETNKYGLLYYIQRGFDLRGSVEPLSQWKEGGLRSLQITYADNELGGGSSSNDKPLSPFGKQVVKEMNRLRMIIDISHCGKRTTLDVCRHSNQPVTANHADVERLSPHRRNKSDEELKAIAETGGVVGITLINRFILKDPSRPATIEDFVNHIDYAVELIGIDHVGIASDCYLDGTQVYEVDFSDPYLNSYDRWKHVSRRLHKRGYKKEDIQKVLGLNFKNIMSQVLGS